MSKVILVNPANASVGYSVITPRWLFVIAGATPVEFAGDPVIIDEPVKEFDAAEVGPGDIVGVGIHTGNCRPGYRVVREAKKARSNRYCWRHPPNHISGRTFRNGC
jgi:hypothetical protein